MSKSTKTNETHHSYFRSFAQTLEKLRQNRHLSRQSSYRRTEDQDNSSAKLNEGDFQSHFPTTVSETAGLEEFLSEAAVTRCGHEKGHPFYKPEKNTAVPKFWFLENFKVDDFCFFKSDLLQQKIKAKSWSDNACELCVLLVRDSIAFSIENKFTNRMGLALMEIMYQSYHFLMENNFATMDELCSFFRDMILLYAVDDPPVSMAMYSPMECFVVSQHFWSQFDPIFLLLKAIAVPNYIVKIYVDKS